MRLHERLWKVCKRRASDFEPWGKRSNDERGGDCSSGCRWFLTLQDVGRGAKREHISMDWGVCINPKSPRAGLLTFEHQGCPKFKYGSPQSTEAIEEWKASA